MIDVDELERLEKLATPRPWTRKKPGKDADGYVRGVLVAGTLGRQGIYASPAGGQFPSADADLIVAARNSIWELIERVRKAEARVAELEAASRALLSVLDVVSAKSNPIFAIAASRGFVYDGPSYGQEALELRQLLGDGAQAITEASDGA